jgi:hypothetical protein
VGSVVQHRGNIAENGLDANRCLFEREFAGFDLGQIENGIDDLQQMLARRFRRSSRSI